MNLYRSESDNPKWNAQRNLAGRTHYVDDDTLRWHKSKVLSTYITDHGLLFAIITSDALDMNNTKRGYRYAIFDVFGNVVARPNLEDSFKSKEPCRKAMWAALNSINARDITLKAIESARRNYNSELDLLTSTVNALQTVEAA